MKNNAAYFWKLPWSVHSDSFLLTSRDDLFCAPRMESRSARCPRSVCSNSWKPNLYKACYLMATCMWQLCDWTDKSPHEGGTQRFVYRWTTKHHRMQGLFLWHCTEWKDVLYSAGWLEILPASWVRTFSGTRVRMDSNTVETKLVLTSTCWLTKWLLWDNVSCFLSANSQPWTKRTHRAQFGSMHHPTTFSMPQLCMCGTMCATSQVY